MFHPGGFRGRGLWELPPKTVRRHLFPSLLCLIACLALLLSASIVVRGDGEKRDDHVRGETVEARNVIGFQSMDKLIKLGEVEGENGENKDVLIMESAGKELLEVGSLRGQVGKTELAGKRKDEGLSSETVLAGGNGAADDVVWIIQVTDLHVSKYHPERANALKNNLGELVRRVKPALLIITGDLTDAKNKEKTKTRQDELEWIAYKETIEAIGAASGLPLNSIVDLRGNHDTFGVSGRGQSGDFYSKYGLAARHDRDVSKSVQSSTLRTRNGRRILFTGVDLSPFAGLRGPCNFFGQLTFQALEELDRELGQWDGRQKENGSDLPVTKIVYGHYPLSFVSSMLSGGRRMEEVLAKHNVTAYLCGHVHSRFGLPLFYWHRAKWNVQEREGETGEGGLRQIDAKVGGFWEWELGDWKENRMARVLAVDRGKTSFVDVDFPLDDSPMENSPIVLITFPSTAYFQRSVADLLDNRRRTKEDGVMDCLSAGNEIHVMIFTKDGEAAILAKALIYEDFGKMEVSERREENATAVVDMQHVPDNKGKGPLYIGKWEPGQAFAPSKPGRFVLQLRLSFANGRSILTKEVKFEVEERQSFSSVRKSSGLWADLILGTVWERVFPCAVWGLVFVIGVGLLILPQMAARIPTSAGKCDRLVLEWINPAPASISTDPTCIATAKLKSLNLIRLFFIGLLESAKNLSLWVFQLLHILYIIFCPWFWAVGMNKPQLPWARMHITGWMVLAMEANEASTSPSPSPLLSWRFIPTPDVLIIVVPFLLLIVLPTSMWIVAMAAEEAVRRGRQNVSKEAFQKGDKKKKGAKNMAEEKFPLISTEEDLSSAGIQDRSSTAGKQQQRRRPLSLVGGLADGGGLAGDDGHSRMLTAGGTASMDVKLASWRRDGGSQVRTLLYGLGVGLVLHHLRFCWRLANDYGTISVIASPGLSWYLAIMLYAFYKSVGRG